MNADKLKNFSYWELHGHSYIGWLTILIYVTWVFSPTYEIASEIWIFILSLFGSYVNESGLIIFIILFSHALSLLLSDAISKPVKLLKLTIKDMGLEIFPSKAQIESDNNLADLEKDFKILADKIKSKAG